MLGPSEFNPSLHPHGPGGRFRETTGGLPNLPSLPGPGLPGGGDDVKPLRLYHGTNQEFGKFSMAHAASGADSGDRFSDLGVFFTPDRRLARVFGRNVVSADVTIRKPLHVDLEDLYGWDDNAGELKLKVDPSELRQQAIRQGHDAVVIDPVSSSLDEQWGLGGEFDHPQYALLDPRNARIVKDDAPLREAARKVPMLGPSLHSKFTPSLHPHGAKGQFRETTGGMPSVPSPARPGVPGRGVPEVPRVPAPGGRKGPTPLPIPAPPKEKWIDVGSDVNRAADLLSQGQYVRLDQKREASTLLAELAKRVQSAKAAGKDAPDFDLCRVTVKNTNLFCAESQGIPRIKMPQLSGKPRPGTPAAKLPLDSNGEVDLGPLFRKHLEAEGHKVTDDTVPASHLRASQDQLNGGKVGGMVRVLDAGRKLGEGKPIFVSKDDYIVDGHHRWAAEIGKDLEDGKLGDQRMKVEQVDMNIVELLAAANDYGAKMGLPRVGVNQAFPPLPKDLQVKESAVLLEDWRDFDAARHSHLLGAGRRIRVKIGSRKFEGRIKRRSTGGTFLAEVGGVRHRLRPREIHSIMESDPLLEADVSPGSAMVALFPSPDVAGRLAVPGGEPPEDHHVTLAALGQGPWSRNQLDGVRASVLDAARRQSGPIRGVVSGTGTFTEGDQPVAYYSADCPGLEDFRYRLVSELERRGLPVDRTHTFDPHITAAYGDPPDGWEDGDGPGTDLEFPAVSIVVGGNRYDVPLSVEAPPDAMKPEPDGVQESIGRGGSMGLREDWSEAARRAALEARRAKGRPFTDKLSPAPDVDVDALHRLPDFGKIVTHDGIQVEWVPPSQARYRTGEGSASNEDGYRFIAHGLVRGFVKNAEDVPAKVKEIRDDAGGVVREAREMRESRPGRALSAAELRQRRDAARKQRKGPKELSGARWVRRTRESTARFLAGEGIPHSAGSIEGNLDITSWGPSIGTIDTRTRAEISAALRHLHQKGYVEEVKDRPEDAPPGKLFQITDHGVDWVGTHTEGRLPYWMERARKLNEREFSAGERRKAAGAGAALPDGSFPIHDVRDLQNAVRAVGRADPAKRPAVRAHIKRRARALGVENPLA